MKKILTFIAAAVFVIYPSVSFSSYIIHLKDGREFATDRYYEEGDQIKFKRYGGVIGIQKDLVKEIEEIEDVEELPEEKETPAEPEAPAAGAKTGKKEKTEEGAEKAEAPEEEVPEAIKGEEESEKEKPVEVSEEEKKKAEQEKAAKMQTFLEEKRQIMGQMQIVAAGLKDAQGKNNKAEKRKWLMERTKLLNTLSELENSVKSAHDGKLPDWWQNNL